jgi:hypothetical protein
MVYLHRYLHTHRFYTDNNYCKNIKIKKGQFALPLLQELTS